MHNNGSSVIRAASFQSRLNLSGYSTMTCPGSDNDSLHSSTSSLDYSGGGGGALTLTKLGSYSSPLRRENYHRTQPHFPQQHQEEEANFGKNPNLKKFFSYGNGFHSEIVQGSVMRLGVPKPRAINHGSMPSLDLQIHDGGGGMMNIQRGRGGDRMSPGLRYANTNANWNGRCHNTSAFGEQQGSHILMACQSKAKETPRLNKFPLDLESLVSSTSSVSSIKAQEGSMNPHPPKPSPRSAVNLNHHTSPPSTSVSPSASLSSLDSSSDTPLFSLHHTFLPFSSCSPTPSQGSIPPERSCSPGPLSTAQSPQTDVPSGPQVVQVVSNLPSSYSPSSLIHIHAVEDDKGDARDSVESILQRIASFSQHALTDTIPPLGAQFPAAQSNSGLSSVNECPVEPTPRWKKVMRKWEGKVFFSFCA